MLQACSTPSKHLEFSRPSLMAWASWVRARTSCSIYVGMNLRSLASAATMRGHVSNVLFFRVRQFADDERRMMNDEKWMMKYERGMMDYALRLHSIKSRASTYSILGNIGVQMQGVTYGVWSSPIMTIWLLLQFGKDGGTFWTWRWSCSLGVRKSLVGGSGELPIEIKIRRYGDTELRDTKWALPYSCVSSSYFSTWNKENHKMGPSGRLPKWFDFLPKPALILFSFRQFQLFVLVGKLFNFPILRGDCNSWTSGREGLVEMSTAYLVETLPLTFTTTNCRCGLK